MKHFLRELILLLLLLILVLAGGKSNAQEGEQPAAEKNHEKSVVLYHGFESGLPSGWVQQYLTFPDGFYANWDTRKGAGIIAPGTFPTIGEPDTAAVGNRNLVFQWQGQGHRTRLISMPIDLEFVVHPVLSFYHAQVRWGSGQDRLVIYYKHGENGPLVHLATYNHEVPIWTHRSIPLTDHETDKFYLVFEGINGHGSGVCIDELTITETGYIPKTLDTFTSEQASHDFIPSGTVNNPILRSQVRVTGNTGDLLLQKYTAQSLNTDDADVTKLKLYITDTEIFNTNNLLGELNGFTAGVATFNNINHNLPTGYSYLWLTYDIHPDAPHGNIADAMIPAGGIIIGEETVPLEAQSPFGYREIYETIFYDDFETNKGWTLAGEWERAIPLGFGGPNIPEGSGLPGHGFPGASYAYIGQKILGTDITGLGEFPGNYEPNLDSLAYQAITPLLDCFYYTDIKLSFHRWLNIEFTDKAYIHVSGDGGASWQQVWVNNNFFSSLNWEQETINLPGANRKENMLIRFSIGPTDPLNNYSGWNIDNLVVTGTYVTRDVGISELLAPVEGCGMSSSEDVIVQIENFGAKEINAPIPIGFSLNGGQTWHMDTLYVNLEVGDSILHTFTPKADFSTPGRYNMVVKTFWSEDQDPSNNSIERKIFSIPYITPPYTETFINNDGLWTGYGYRSSWSWGTPFGQHINQAQSGTRAWFTNRGGSYNELEASWLESPCFNFSTVQNPVMEFHLNTHTPEPLAGTTLQYTLDEGVNWHTLGVLNEDFSWNWFDNHSHIQLLEDNFGNPQGWSGNSAGWKKIRAILEPSLGGAEKVKFRFAFAGHHFGGSPNSWEGIGFDAISIYESPHDVGIAAIVEPGNACHLDQNQSISVSIMNYGLNAIKAGTEIPVGIDVNEESPVYEVFTLASPLSPGSQATFTFQTTFDLSAETTHTITSYTLMPGDTDFYYPGVFNDTLSVQITVFGYPEFTLGDDIYTTQPDTVLLNAGAGFSQYLWQDGSIEQTFQVNSIHSAFYSVSVTDHNGCQVSDSLEVISRDFQVLAITDPVNQCELSDQEYITVSLRNSGPDIFASGLALPLQLEYAGQPWDEGVLVLDQDLHPGHSATYTFASPIDFSQVGAYNFSIVLDYPDADPINNSLNTQVIVHGYPQPFIGDTLYTLNPESIVLDAGDYIEFLWQDGQTDRYYPITNPYSAWYSVQVIDQFGCPGSDSVLVITYDIEIAGFVEPQDACELSDEEPIGITLINNGPESFGAGTTFPFVLLLEGEVIGQDTLALDETWSAGEEQIFYFSPTLSMSVPKTYNFTVYMAQPDANNDNNQLNFSVTVHGYPNIFLPPFITTDYPETIILVPGEGYASYLWHDGSTQSTFHVETWGDFWVEVSNSFGCTSTAQTQILPELFDVAVHAIAEPLNICANDGNRTVKVTLKNTGNSALLPGTELTLHYTLEGQSTVEQTFILSSTFIPGTTRNFSFSQPIHLTEPGAYGFVAGVIYDVDEVPDNNQLNETLTVFDIPQPNLGGNVYTLNPQGHILNPGAGYETYLWQDGSQQPTFTVQQLQSAHYSVTVTDANGCHNSDAVEVISYNLILDSVIAPVSHCTLTQEEAVVVRVLNEGYDDFAAGTSIGLGFKVEGRQDIVETFTLSQQWQKNEAQTFVFDATANLAATGSYRFRAYVATPNADALSDTLEVMINVPGMPVVNLGNDIYTSKPDTVVLDAGAGFASYYWYNGHSGQTYNVNTFGWKWVRVTDIYGCVGSDTLYVGFFQNVAEVSPQWETKVYPNPTRDNITLEIIRETGELLLEVIDINGNIILRDKVFTDGVNRQNLDLSYLKPGVYFLRLSRGELRKIHRITIIQ